MVKELTDRKIPINKIHVDPKKMFTPRAKIEAFLAQNKELKESAQRALINYVKSIALMKNKDIFKVEALNIEAYAQSLGLMFAPRVKFLQGVKYFAEKKRAQTEKGDDEIARKLETNDSDESEGDDSDEKSGDEEQSEEEQSENETETESESKAESNVSPKQSKKSGKEVKTNQFYESSDDDEDDDDEDDFMRIKRRDHEIEEDTLPEVPDLAEVKAKKQKVVTKAALAKKLIKKKILPNKKVEFDEEGNELETANTLKSDLAKEYEKSAECGIDILKARELIKEEDKFDKERFKQMVKAKHREKKVKSKKDKNEQAEQDDFGSADEESDGPDMSWLPDPDKIYANKSSDVFDSESESGFGGRQVVNSSSDDDSECEEEHPVRQQNKRKHQIHQNVDSDQSEEEPSTSKKIRKITSKLTVDDAESFAMQLLSK